jgi:hypothetical protein
MTIQDLPPIRSKQGNKCKARWNGETKVVEILLYHYPSHGNAGWQWINVGTAASNEAACKVAVDYLRGK